MGEECSPVEVVPVEAAVGPGGFLEWELVSQMFCTGVPALAYGRESGLWNYSFSGIIYHFLLILEFHGCIPR